MPPIYKGHAGATSGWYRPGQVDDVNVLLHFGVMRDLGNPVVGLAALGLDAYGGVRGNLDLDGGGRALFAMPALHLAAGLDYSVLDRDLSPLVRLEVPVRRGGLFGRGSALRFDWLPGRHNTLAVGVNVPLWGRNIGQTRSQRDAVELERPPIVRIAPDPSRAAIDSALALVRESALWLARLGTPLTDRGGGDAAGTYAAPLTELRHHLGRASPRFPRGRTLPAEIEAYHDVLERVFAMALSDRSRADPVTPAAQQVATAARRVLLDEVLLPYNRLLGQRKANDGLQQFAAVAHATFARWLLAAGAVPDDRLVDVEYAFQAIVDIAERVRAEQARRWGDSRLVWLPLQLALRPEDHDTQAELDDLIERATNERFTRGNRSWYVMNEEFQLEMARSVHLAEDYHVLWIHDFRGKNAHGAPDELAFKHVVHSYLAAMTRRVRDYDRTHRLPQYFLFLDQHYFEVNRSRLWLRVLLDPMDEVVALPRGYEAWERELALAQQHLRSAVADSKLLQAEAQQYGEPWLRNRIRVHVNVTNPADPSFTSLHLAGILPVPDNVARDHRKIAFYDITEDDPYRGLAMYTGMGIGEHYAGRNWEDRAIIVQGPAALSVKDAARQLLRNQGFDEAAIPLPLRARAKPDDYEAKVATGHAQMLEFAPGWHGRLMELHNETGFRTKQINVANAVLFSLMPRGSVIQAPDALWQSYLYASLLAGSALRGCKVLIIAPARDAAPSASSLVLARAHGLLAALVVFQRELGDAIEAEGGLLKTGLYQPRVGVGDLPGRIRQGRELDAPWLTALFSPNPAVSAVLDSAEAIFERAGYSGQYLVASDSALTPKLHLKANVFISGSMWERLTSRPEWGPVFREYLAYLAQQSGPLEGRLDVRAEPLALMQAVQALARGVGEGMSAAERDRALAYFTVGSANLNYRSMVLDGEVMILVTGWNTLVGSIDFLGLAGLCVWVDDLEALGQVLPPPGWLTRKTANLLKLLL